MSLADQIEDAQAQLKCQHSANDRLIAGGCVLCLEAECEALRSRLAEAEVAVGATMIDLAAIRARDADYNDVFEAQASMSKDIAHRLVAWPVADRRALLKAYDELREAAGKVRCDECGDNGEIPDGEEWVSCPDCTDLRRLLGEGKP